ncbi:galactose-3-O-sulfotransferase 2 [Nematostella vectensis]|uniref:galactose-3-O-sulfotransferase 2 n=1 Tax=Nematostella vectensis TaxID=45351 RepID=UPI002077403A|nr:galactose-3-O-sulfotransferase 2 [Nematostella vectensis]
MRETKDYNGSPVRHGPPKESRSFSSNSKYPLESNMIFRNLKALFYVICAVSLMIVCVIVVFYDFKTSPRNRSFTHGDAILVDARHNTRKKSCTPKKNVVFLKTHKTGSSTISNIFHRYGEKHDLVFVLPVEETTSLLGWPWFFQESHVKQYNVKPNILCSHARYNRATLTSFMPNDTVYVTILRDPVTQFESTFSYMKFSELLGISNESDALETFLEKPKEILVDYVLTKDLRVNSHRLKLIRNGMFFDLGLESKDFENKTRIADSIKDLESQFDLIMLLEHFDESLVLLRRLLCWEPNDVLYFSINQRDDVHKRVNLPEKLAHKIRQWNSADVALYKHFSKVLRKKLYKQSGEFYSEVKDLKVRNRHMQHMCIDSEKSEKVLLDRNIKGFRIRQNITRESKNTCDRMTLMSIDYQRILRRKQDAMLRRHKSLMSRMWERIVTFFNSV